MKSDAELQLDVLQALEAEPRADAQKVGVAVTDGVVTLTGTVSTYYEKWVTERVAKRVEGTRAVANDIKVRLPYEITDADIAKGALDALANDISLPRDHIEVIVENGWVTLEGRVDWQYQKEAAESAVRNLRGVVGIKNQIRVKPQVKPSDVKAKIEAGFKRDAHVDAENIHVETLGATVKLTGVVHSWFEREEAERAVWRVPGVEAVQDDIAFVS